MRQNLCLLIAFFCLCVFGPLRSQDRQTHTHSVNPGALLPLNPALYGIDRWHPGEAAEYILVTFQGEKKETKRVRYAVLSEQRLGASQYFVVENQVTTLDDLRHTTINSVTRPFGDLSDLLEGATGVFVSKQDQQPAQSIPVSKLKQNLFPTPSREKSPRIVSTEYMGQDSIQTKDGKHKAVHQKLLFSDGRSIEVWWSRDAGPLGVLKAISRDFTLELFAHQNKKALSSITEIPQSIP